MNVARLLGDRILVELIEEEQQSPGGIALPESATRRELRRGVVRMVGPGSRTLSGTIVPVDLREGDRVLFEFFQGRQVTPDDKSRLLIGQGNVVAVLK